MNFITYYSAGTVSVTNGSTALVFTGTSLLANVVEGDIFNLKGYSIRIAADPADNTHATLAQPWPGTTASGLAYEILITPPGSALAATTRQLIEGLDTNLIGIAQLTPSGGDTLTYNGTTNRWVNSPVSGFIAASGLTLGGTLTTSGAYNLTLTLTANTNVTLPTTGTLATRAGVETLTNKSVDASANTITNLTTSMFAANVVDNDVLLAADSAARLPTQHSVKSYVDALVQGLKWKAPVATIFIATAGTRSGEKTNDGYTTSNDRVLLTADGVNNGIWVTGSGAWVRATDADTGAELVNASTLVENGTSYGKTVWTCTNASITLGTTSLTFVQVGTNAIVAGTGLTLAGSTLGVTANGITYSLIQTMVASSLLGNPTGSTATPQAITIGSNLAFSGTSLNLAGNLTGPIGIGMSGSNILDITQTQNAASVVKLLNANTSTAASAELSLANATHTGFLRMYGTGFTTSGLAIQDSLRLDSGAAAGGLTLNTSAAQPIRFGTNGSEVARMTSAGDVLVGVTSSSGSQTNTTKLVAGIHSTLSGSVGGGSLNTYVTLFNLGNQQGGWLVTVTANVGSASYSGTCIVTQDGTNCNRTNVHLGGNLDFVLSGNDLTVRQTSSGGTLTFQWTALRIHG